MKNFLDIGKEDAAMAGGKGASLGEMTRAGIPVPPGFVILADAFETFLQETDLAVEIDAILHTVDIEKMHTVEHASERIQKLILEAKMPEDITVAIQKHFETLGCEYVAVRSSATAEDSSSAAWAGQLESYLNTTESTLLTNVQKCWASLFTPRAIFYRFEKGLHATKISVAVVVQKMVESEVSGIAFSVHPVTEDRNQLIIEAGYGLGEAIVSGQITPDSYVVEKEPRRIVDKNIASQLRALTRTSAHSHILKNVGMSSGPNEWGEIAPSKSDKQKLSDDQILLLSEFILKIENHYGFPCDIEWAYEQGKFYIVQSRPITTLPNDTVTKVNKESLEVDADKGVVRLIERGSADKGEFFVPRARQLMPSPAYWNALVQTSLAIKKLCGDAFTVEYNICSSGSQTVAIPKNEWERVGKYVADRLLHDSGYFERLEKGAKVAEKKIKTYLKKMQYVDLSKESFSQLGNLIMEIQNLFIAYDAATVYSWFVAGNSFKSKMKASLRLSDEDVDIVGTPEDPSLVACLEQEELELALSTESVKVSAKTLAKKYYWVPHGYDGPTLWDEKHFAARLEELRKDQEGAREKLRTMNERQKERGKQAEEILRKKEYTKEELRLVRILRTLSIWTDERKQLDYQLFAWYHRVLAEMGKRYGFSVNELKYLLSSELCDLETDVPALKDVVEFRKTNPFMIVAERGVARIARKEELLEIRNAIQGLSDPKNLQGQVACRGPESTYKARVRVIFSSKEGDKLQAGEILVAPMTTPDYALAMGRALGFITDEGGVTCHAAIVAREMNKPCIIGTKIATQVLEDGDLVEVDAERGTVKILERGTESSRGANDQ